MRSHTGGTMSLRKGSIYITSTKQKLNTKSSMESELVGVNDVMPMILCTKYFLDTQGYDTSASTINQDNQVLSSWKRMVEGPVINGLGTSTYNTILLPTKLLPEK